MSKLVKKYANYIHKINIFNIWRIPTNRFYKKITNTIEKNFKGYAEANILKKKQITS